MPHPYRLRLPEDYPGTAFEFVCDQLQYLMLLWPIVARQETPALRTDTLHTLAVVVGVDPLSSEHRELMRALREVWLDAVQRPQAAGYERWRAAIEDGDTVAACQWLAVVRSGWPGGSDNVRDDRATIERQLRMH